MRDVTLLGSTGSIGTQALDLLGPRRADYRVRGLAAGGSNTSLLAEQILDFSPEVVALARPSAVQDLQLALYAAAKQRGWAKGELKLPKILAGPDAITELAAGGTDLVLNAITGAAGLSATLAALDTKATLALANKESLVIGGRLVTEAAGPDQLVPVDSEHSALAQALRSGGHGEVDKLVLTASGGPFRGRTRAELAQVTPQQAMAHPTWDMGRVITINSASMVNKALEVLEAHLLFDVDLADIEVVVHPQSIVHSMVQFVDGSTIAQCSPPDMRLPIGLALSWPQRLPGASAPIDWSQAASWTFEPLDAETFTAVDLIRRCGAAGGTAPAVFNAANEVAVDAFCEGAIGFTDIVDTVERVVEDHLRPRGPRSSGPISDADVGSSLVGDPELDLASVLAADRWARRRATALTTKTGSESVGPGEEGTDLR
ncbi:1-deoxy-D-xylulose-5-phosphate reductoisomerase [Naumannella halotolerans]|uniref:1-deoxy-D-xylulose 5-phosphate reductoisomerase n=1 Tax=Naumannella halotolerans TaxID=993414 RepID=A0A4R7J693_9ACTN|nr:1-deoxy-D-xylulose-5-phosphate reductoisomerase [Naumannella halotolerans]TDT32902.1 1-deoxy-D-xylulose-5-phosphate reductoisomerase [Naumannella halotolerans]